MLEVVSVLITALTLPWGGRFDTAHVSLLIALCSISIGWLLDSIAINVPEERDGANIV